MFSSRCPTAKKKTLGTTRKSDLSMIVVTKANYVPRTLLKGIWKRRYINVQVFQILPNQQTCVFADQGNLRSNEILQKHASNPKNKHLINSINQQTLLCCLCTM